MEERYILAQNVVKIFSGNALGWHIEKVHQYNKKDGEKKEIIGMMHQF